MSPEFLKSLLRNVPYGLLAISGDGQVTLANKLAVEYLGLEVSAGRLSGQPLMRLLDHFPALQEKLIRCLHHGQKRFTLKSVPHCGRYLDIRTRSVPTGFLLTIGNVTELKEMEARLLQSMMHGQESERRRLARELHDGIGPMLSAVRLQMEALRTDQLDADTDARIAPALELIDDVAAELRSISHALMPRVLLDFGLAEALFSLRQNLTRNKRHKIEVLPTGEFGDLPPQLALALYRSAQELINNALKHAKATAINVQLIRHHKSVVLMVEDNGVGMSEDQQQEARSGIGLLNIESRVTALGGAFVLDSTPLQGTTCTIEVPL